MYKESYYTKQDKKIKAKSAILDARMSNIHHEASRVHEIPTPNIIDRIVGVFRPDKMTRRIGARYSAYLLEREMEGFNQRAMYKAAEISRLNSHWQTSMQDINEYLRTELPRLQARSRWLFANNSHAGEYMNALLNYCVGVGFSLQMQVRKVTTDADGQLEETMQEGFNAFVEDLHEEWAEDININASVSAPDADEDVQTLCFRKLVEDGEYFMHPVVDLSQPTVPLRVEIIEPDSLNTMMTVYEGNPIVMGVELDKNSWRPVAYWMYTARKASPNYYIENKTMRVPAAEIIHVFPKLRPRQVRGVPLLSVVTQRFFDLDEFTDAELIGSKIAACLSVFITQPAGQSDPNMLNAGASQGATDSKGSPISNLEPGMIANVPQGSDVKVVSPQKPGTTFGMFTRYHMKQMYGGAYWGISYLTASRDTEGVTHAGGRLAQQMDFQGFKPIQRFFARKHKETVFKRWFDVAVLAGKIIAPGYFQDRPGKRFWRRHAWLPGGWHWGINPLQEALASKESMRSGITTPDDECSLLGYKADTQLVKIARYQRRARKLGVVTESDASVGRISRTGDAPELTGMIPDEGGNNGSEN